MKRILLLILLGVILSVSVLSAININLFKNNEENESSEEVNIDSLYAIIDDQAEKIDNLQAMVDSLAGIIDSLSQNNDFTGEEYPVNKSFVLPNKYTFAGREFDLKNERIRSKLQTIFDYEVKKAYKYIPRSATYFPIFDSVFAKYGIDPDVKYLAVAESYLSYMAYSSVGAAGIWQFMPGTAKLFNLDINDYVDERRNVFMATDAACRYLKNGHEYLNTKGINDWLLTMAGYNAGMGNITKAVSEQNSTDFFSLIMRHDETNDYIWRAIAIKIIFDNEEQIFGKKFARDPFLFETCTLTAVTLNGYHELNDWAIAKGTNISKIWELNPWIKLSKKRVGRYSKLNKMILPPGQYSILIPKESVTDTVKLAVVEADFNNKAAAPITKSIYLTHKVKRGETLYSIARKYGVTVTQLKKWNHLKRNRLKYGMQLKINREVETDSTGTELVAVSKDTPSIIKEEKKKEARKYVVKNGDTLSRISKKLGVSQDTLIGKNNLKSKKKNGNSIVMLHKGQVLYY